METKRPDPDKLLRQVTEQTKKRGKLKIFFGACAGVGKTYNMLSDAQGKIKEGEDVIIGIVETHGRTETENLCEGIPILPLREIQYQGIILKDLDLDGALKRKPEVLLVDELAHTNSIGSRHPKRWQDVQELLESGINVHTTLNVQHLESLNDTVANVTGIRVKETVPDSILDNADEIVLVDIPSEIIIERLEEGKVYLGEFAKQRAAQHFFKMENLIALREIALRRTAERVDALRAIYQKYKGHDKHQLINEKLLVCIGPKASSTSLVRKAKQLATRLKCPWTALYIENEQHYRLSKEEQLVVEKSLRLAEQLGGKTHVLQETRTAEAIIAHATENGFTRILVSKPSKPKWKQKLFGSLVSALITLSETIDIYVLNEDTPVPKTLALFPFRFPSIAYLNTFFTIAICTLIGLSARELLMPENVVMFYLVGIVIIAASSERSAAVLAALLSVICYKFFFTPPYYSLSIDTYHLTDLVTLSVLLLTGLVISSLTSQLRLQHLFAKRRERYTSELFEFNRKLMVTTSKIKIAKVIAHHIGDAFDCAVTVWLPDATGYLELASHPGIKAELKEESVAQWAFAHHQIAGLGTDTMPSARGYYVPLVSGKTVLGVLGLIPKDPNRIFTGEENMMLEALAIQGALALEKTKDYEKSKK